MERKYSERYMKFPIRMYRSEDVERGEEFNIEDIEYAIGYVRICPYDIIEWFQCFSRPRTIEDVKREGFDSTRFKTKSGEFYDCTWDVKKFEERIDRWIEQFEKEFMVLEKEDMGRKNEDLGPL